MPLQAREISGFQVLEHQNPLKNRALRAPRAVTLTSEIGYGALANGK